MNRKPIVTLTAIALSLTAGAALAQSGPDFSPMRPPSFDQPPVVPSAAASDTVVAPEPPVTTQNRMLDAYEQSSALPGEARTTTVYERPATMDEARSAVYESPPRARLQAQPPRQSTIGNGLFDRRGPNDFGS